MSAVFDHRADELRRVAAGLRRDAGFLAADVRLAREEGRTADVMSLQSAGQQMANAAENLYRVLEARGGEA